jgi:hypothetical protein
MTAGHVLFATMLTGYMGLAALIEERDLVNHFGRQYEDYRKKVPMFLPRLTPAAASSATSAESKSVAETPYEQGA